MIIRPPAVAGLFYPGDADSLRAAVGELLADTQASPVNESQRPPKAIIAPHAGYIYSGSIAAAAYAKLWTIAARVERVVLIGPAHRVPLHGLATSGADSFATPLGTMRVDREAVANVETISGVEQNDRAHRDEHSLEVQLPFLQVVLPDAAIIPLLVGDAPAALTAHVLERSWGGPETVFVVSSDLSHYHTYDAAVALDSSTAATIVAGNGAALDGARACGHAAIQGLLTASKHHALSAVTLSLANSGDTAGDKSRVVGYGAWALA